jgi:hypothetical protein
MNNKLVIGVVVLMLLLSATACKHGQSPEASLDSQSPITAIQ